MISTGGSFFSGWRMVRFLTTILPKSAERRKPPFEPTHVEKAQLQNLRRGGRGGDAGTLEIENGSSRLARGIRKD